MNLGSAVFAIIVLGLGLVYETMALNMPRGDIAFPGPGLFPTIVGAFLIATSLACLVQEILARRRTPGTEANASAAQAAPEPVRHTAKTVQLTLLMVAYGLALKPLGFPLSITVFLALAINIFGFRRPLPGVAIALAIAIASYLAFVVWLGVPLPLGVLDEFLE